MRGCKLRCVRGLGNNLLFGIAWTRLDIWEAQQLVSVIERAEAQECQFAASRVV